MLIPHGSSPRVVSWNDCSFMPFSVLDEMLSGITGTTLAIEVLAFLNPLPHLRTMDGNIGIDFEAQSNPAAFDRKHGDSQDVMQAICPSNHN